MVAHDVCAIIKACGRSGVSHIKVQDLEIQFGFQGSLPLALGSHRNDDLPKTETVTVTEAGQALSNNNLTMEPMDKEALRDFELVDAAISNPLAYEQMMMDGDLEGTESSRP